MRIIAGKLRGKILQTPSGDATRPTADRARETLFDVLTSALLKQGISWNHITFADIFAGSGAVGIEAFSRGAADVVCLENDPQALKCLKANAQQISQIHVYPDNALSPPPHAAVSILFMDAPYGVGLWQRALPALEKAGWIDQKTIVIVETDRKLNEKLPDGFTLLQERAAGRNVFLFAKQTKES